MIKNIVNIYNCPHCNQNHYNIQEFKFNIPMPPLSYWLICPKTFKVIYCRGAGIYKSVSEILDIKKVTYEDKRYFN